MRDACQIRIAKIRDVGVDDRPALIGLSQDGNLIQTCRTRDGATGLIYRLETRSVTILLKTSADE